MKTLLLGYQSIGQAALATLLELGQDVTGVVTHRDDPKERLWWKPLQELARGADLPLYYFEDLGWKGLERLLLVSRPDIILSAYFRRVIPGRLLKGIPRSGLNIHGSLLPKYRGRSPANWVLVNGEAETGVTLHEMISRADAGPIVDQIRIPIGPRETIATLYARMVEATGVLLRRSWSRVRQGTEQRVPQDESQATYVRGRRPEDGEFDWTWPAHRIDCLVRAVGHPYPGAFCVVRGRKLFVWEGRPVRAGVPSEGFSVRCGQGAYEILHAQWEGELEEIPGRKIPSHLIEGAVP